MTADEFIFQIGICTWRQQDGSLYLTPMSLFFKRQLKNFTPHLVPNLICYFFNKDYLHSEEAVGLSRAWKILSF